MRSTETPVHGTGVSVHEATFSPVHRGTIRLVEYRRVSSAGQLDGLGMDVQAAANGAFAEVNGHRIVRVTEDGAVSGTLPAAERPGLLEALELIQAGEVDGLVCAKLDRLARELSVQESTLAVVWQMGGRVFTAEQGEVLPDDPDDPLRTLLRQIVGAVSQFDRALVAKRLRDGRKAKAAQGRHAVGVYAFGYEGAGKGRERDAAPLAAEQATVARIVALRAGGMSYREVCAQLAAEGHVTRHGGPWQPATVRKVVLREAGG